MRQVEKIPDFVMMKMMAAEIKDLKQKLTSIEQKYKTLKGKVDEVNLVKNGIKQTAKDQVYRDQRAYIKKLEMDVHNLNKAVNGLIQELYNPAGK